jgi:hypothetical protein
MCWYSFQHTFACKIARSWLEKKILLPLKTPLTLDHFPQITPLPEFSSTSESVFFSFFYGVMILPKDAPFEKPKLENLPKSGTLQICFLE